MTDNEKNDARELFCSLCTAYEIIKKNNLHEQHDEYNVLKSYLEDALSELSKRCPFAIVGAKHSCYLHSYNLDNRCAVCGKVIDEQLELSEE